MGEACWRCCNCGCTDLTPAQIDLQVPLGLIGDLLLLAGVRYKRMMDDIYQYPVFFTCRTLSDVHIKRLENHFCIRRKSGGGDCGPLISVGDSVYSIAFRNQRDQQAVLQRSEHVLELEDGCLVFAVRDSLESDTSSHITTPTAPAETPDHIPTSSALPSAEEYELHQGMGTGSSTPSDLSLQPNAPEEDSTRGATAGAPGGGVHVEIIQGSIQTQQVDALVCPMVDHNPLSTRVGNALFEIAGPQLITSFRKNAEDETMPGDSVLVEGLPGLPSNAVFFLSLVPFDGDPDGVAVQVLRLGINQILSSCEERGFGSVALPVLGAGIALQFPVSVVEKVLREAIHDFDQQQTGRTPFVIRIVIHHNDEESSEVFESVQNDKFTEDFFNQRVQDQESTTMRMVLLGKTGSGKSHLANTILGEDHFTSDHSANSGTSKCQAETKRVNGRSITLIDTPGFFDTGRSEADLNPEIMNCITECAPGPHAFLIVLRVDKFTEQEQAVVTKICQFFTDEALKHAVVVFTHGDQLPKKMKIEDFVSQNQNLSALVSKCGGRCHVFDNKHWNNKQPNNYRSNQFQVEELLKTIEKMVAEKNGGYYTNEMLQHVEKKIEEKAAEIRQSSPDKTPEEIRNQAKRDVCNSFLIQMTGMATGVLLGVFFGVVTLAEFAVKAVKNPQLVNATKTVATLARAPAAAPKRDLALVAVGVVGLAAAAGGGVMGGVIGIEAAKDAKSPGEAAQRAYEAVLKKRKSVSDSM